MEIKIPYLGEHLRFDLPLPEKNIKVLRSKDPAPAKDPEAIVKDGLQRPIGKKRLSDIVRPGNRVALMFDDWTRPTPVSKIIPSVMEELERGGVKRRNILLVCGNGMHAPDCMTEELLIEKLGREIYQGHLVLSHDAYDYRKLKFIGLTKTLGTPLFISKHVAQADVKVAIGRIAPHSEMGYSGGAKMIMPGVSAIWSIIHHHTGSYPRRGILKNVLRQDIDECGRMAGLDFIVNVVCNSKEEILRAFAGDPWEAFLKGVEYGDKEVWGARIKEPAEIVITSPGLNMDQYFIPSLKCLGVANQCIKDGGTIIVVASCSQGWSDRIYLDRHWHPTKDLLEYDYPGLLWLVMSKAWHEPNQQFQALVYYVQHIAKTCFEKDVVLVGSKGFSAKEARKLNLTFEESIDHALRNAVKKHGENSKVIVIPSAFTLPLKRPNEIDDRRRLSGK